MILTCPNCTTRFLLPAQILAPEGKKVKCSACEEMWFQLPDPEELEALNRDPLEQEVPESIQPRPETHGVPAVHDEEDSESGGAVGGAIAASVFFVLLTAVFLFMKPVIIQSIPGAMPIYEMIGAEMDAPGTGIVFDKLQARVAAKDEGAELVDITGRLINLTPQDQSMPMIRAEFLDSDDVVLSQFMIQPPSPDILGEGMMDFAATLENSNPAAERIKLSLSLTAMKTAAR